MENYADNIRTNIHKRYKKWRKIRKIIKKIITKLSLAISDDKNLRKL